MHPEALEGVAWALDTSDIQDMADIEVSFNALDLGGADVNGTARHVVDDWMRPSKVTWTGADIEAGPGVDVVLDATGNVPFRMVAEYDIVLCTEVLEHVERWQELVSNIHLLLSRGGYAFITCAGAGRRPHGARGALDPAPGEWYKNVEHVGLMNRLKLDQFSEYEVRYNSNPGDLYAWARK